MTLLDNLFFKLLQNSSIIAGEHVSVAERIYLFLYTSLAVLGNLFFKLLLNNSKLAADYFPVAKK